MKQMKKSLNKILAGLTLLILLPLAVAILYEYTRINENEELITSVYKGQLETIISSVNYYSEDIMSNWAGRIDVWMMHPSDSTVLKLLTSENSSILAIYAAQRSTDLNTIYSSGNEGNSTFVSQLLKKERQTIDKLISYHKSNYRKFHSFETPDGVLMTFVTVDKNLEYVPILIELDLRQFIHQHISSRIQDIAKDKFLIRIFHEESGATVYTSDKEMPSHMTFDKEGGMWLFPGLSIGITLRNESIADLASRRVKEGLILAALVMAVLVVGIWFIYSSVKKEVNLAQIKSEFISNVSHEIRTPLALISMYAETLEMGRVNSPEKAREYYQTINSESQRLNAMVDKILNFSRMEKGRYKFKTEVCNLNNICAEVLGNYQEHYNGADISFNADSKLPEILADKVSVSEALLNLIDNAVKYSRDNKKIEITTGHEDRMCFVEVKDNGIGISKKDQKHIFDRFYRVTRQNLANEVKGTGLGLSIVCETMKAHKGRVTVQSKPGAGSSFRLYFPVIRKSN